MRSKWPVGLVVDSLPVMSNSAACSFGIGIVGTGTMARRHLDILSNHANVHSIAICHSERSAREGLSLKAKYGARYTTSSYETLLSDAEIDLLWICSPNHHHLKHVGLGLQAGKHVFCEKPLALSVADVAALSRLAQSSGRLLAVGMNCRFRQPYSGIKEFSKKIGRIQLLRATYLYNSEEVIKRDEKPWWKNPENHPILLTSGLIHALDLLLWIGGPIRTVTCLARAVEFDDRIGADSLALGLTFESGALGQLAASFVCALPNTMSVEVYGSEGSVIGNKIVTRSGSGYIEEALDVKQGAIDLQLQADNILHAMAGGETLVNGAQEALALATVCDAAREALRSGCPVDVHRERHS